MSELTYSGILVTANCWCGIRHAIPSELHNYQESAHRDGRQQPTIYCPLGHAYIIAGEGEAAELRERLKDEKRRLQATRDLLHAEERSHSATRGHLTRTKKRVAHGVCPCCNRSFANVGRHMKTKHPDYVEEAGT